MRQKYRVCKTGCHLSCSTNRPVHWWGGGISWETIWETHDLEIGDIIEFVGHHFPNRGSDEFPVPFFAGENFSDEFYPTTDIIHIPDGYLEKVDDETPLTTFKLKEIPKSEPKPPKIGGETYQPQHPAELIGILLKTFKTKN